MQSVDQNHELIKKNKIIRMQNIKQSQQTKETIQSQDSGNPQRSMSIRKAAARLKQKQAQLDIIKKRFQVLKGQEDYNRYRTLDQQRRIKQHRTIHESLKSDRQSFQKQLQKQKESEEKLLKQRHDKLMQQMRQKSKSAYEDLLTSRISDKNKLKQQSKNNDETIEKNKKQSIQMNARKKEEILSQQKRQKELVNQFKTSQIKSIIGNRTNQASRLTLLTEAKDKQLQQLMELQQQMLKKASQSIAIKQKLKDQYGKVFVEVKEKNSIRFPSISRQSGSHSSNYSNLSRNLSIYEI